MPRPLRVAIVGAGPAGIYAADILTKNDQGIPVSIDLFERLPAPFGLVRYGVAPDHPRIKAIINALFKVLDRGDIRLFGNVAFGQDLRLTDIHEFYDAIILATGADTDRRLTIPGIDLEGSYGAADFVSWYDGHPDVPRTWPLEAREIAVVGNGNVALDVARILVKHPEDLLPTEIPDNVYRGLLSSPVTDVHVFGRRGPAQVKFTPLELRELGHVPDVDIVVNPEDYEFDEASMAAIHSSNQVKQVVKTLTDWTLRDPAGASRRLHLHFFESPAEVLGVDGRVTGLRTERTEFAGEGRVRGTGRFTDWPAQAVYHAVGYRSHAVPEIPFDEERGVISNVGGRVVDEAGAVLPGIYTTGWVKRGPVGLIGNTKGDALETIGNLLADREHLLPAVHPGEDAVPAMLAERGIEFTTWAGWHALDDYEKALGEEASTGTLRRERVKVVPREDMVRISRAGVAGRAEDGPGEGARAV